MSTSSSESSKFDPSRRRLCPDGACIGVLDDSGRCKVCGLVDKNVAAAGGRPLPAPAQAPAAPEPDDDDEDQDDREIAGGGTLEATGDFDPKRKLCEDGACVGVVRPDGFCNLCGRLQGNG